MKRFTLAVLPGDGIGPEVTAQALRALRKICKAFDLVIEEIMLPFGGCAIDAHGTPLPAETLSACRTADAVLLGAVGGPMWDGAAVRPEAGLLKLRKAMGLYTNLRPAFVVPGLERLSPLRDAAGVDLLIVRELTGGLYFGDKGRRGDEAYDTLVYARREIDRVCRAAFEAALRRRRRLTSVDKANVLETSRMWRERVDALSAEYPGVALEHLYVDNAAMRLALSPRDFDVLVTENMFGDILSDEAAAVVGTIGLLPSASLGDPGAPGLFEPVHGSAPELAGLDAANPVAAVLSAAMLLRHGLGEDAAADCVESAVRAALRSGARCADMSGDGPVFSTREMGSAILERIAC